jgi:NADPH:quinone reductase-like Zn-dependent oxidoreductase
MRRLRRFIVRKQEQVDSLTKLGAKLVVNFSSDTFKKDLYKAIDATGATLAFDAMDQGVRVLDLRKFY